MRFAVQKVSIALSRPERKKQSMTRKLTFAFMTLLVGGAPWFTSTAKADAWNKETVLTFDKPVEIPGKVLGAGTYVFRLLDSASDRSIVQIFSEQQELVATLMAVPDYRLEPTGETVVTFEERPSGSPPALHTWFYPGDTYGLEFVYPKSDLQIAAKSEEPTSVTPASAPIAEPTPIQQEVTPDNEPPTPIVETQEEPAAVAEEEPAAPAETSVTEDQDAVPNELPNTAGNFVLIPLVGILLLAAGLGAVRSAKKLS